MKVIQAIPRIGNNMGGIVSVIGNLVPALKQESVDAMVVGQTWPGEDPGDSVLTDLDHHYVETQDNSGYGVSFTLVKDLRKLAKAADIVQCHGLWMFMNYATYAAAKGTRKPYVVTFHGMAEPWILSRSRLKKRAVEDLFQMRSLQTAACIHAICEPELHSIRQYGVRAPVAVIPNGVNLNRFQNLPDRSIFEDRYPELKSKKRLLFMARLHPKKGLLPLLEAWKTIAGEFADWQLVIAGPDEKGHRAEVEAVIESGRLHESVSLIGMVAGSAKLETLAAADAFVLPSFSEGFSVSIIEAMASGLPVILTPGCNFPEATRAGAAIEVNPTPEELAEALRSLLGAPESDRQDMGARGRDLVARNYTWDHIAHDMKAVYEWALGGGPAPSCVHLN